LAASTTKRIFIYRFDRQPSEGLVNPSTCLLDAHLEVLTPNGNLIGVSYAELKAFCYVSENAEADLFEVHPFFERRPKSPGLWTRFTFRDSSKVDGLLSHNLLDWPENGYFVTPPRAGANRQRVFIPRLALTETELLGVVGKPTASIRRRPVPDSGQQLPMFE
jgi:hypothetical protein